MKFDIPPPPYECVVISIDDNDIVAIHKNAKTKSSASIINKTSSKQGCSETEVMPPPAYEDTSMHI